MRLKFEEGGQYRITGHAATQYPYNRKGTVTLMRIDTATRRGDRDGYDVIYWCKAPGVKHNMPLFANELEPA